MFTYKLSLAALKNNSAWPKKEYLSAEAKCPTSIRRGQYISHSLRKHTRMVVTKPAPFFTAHYFRCPPGYNKVGEGCVNENECEWYPCINGGICRDHKPPLRYECICPKDFTGGHCELTRSALKASRAFVIVVIVCLIILLGEYWMRNSWSLCICRMNSSR